MTNRKEVVAVLTMVVVLGLGVLASTAFAATPALTTIKGTASPAAAKTTDPRVGAVSSSSAIDFEVQLKLPKLSAAEAFATAVSTPGTARYGRFLSPSQWEAQFSPTTDQVDQVKAFLRSSGFTVLDVTPDRMAIDASGTTAQVEQAFATNVAYFNVAGTKLRLETRDLSVPTSLAGLVAGVTGISQTIQRTTDTTGNPVATPANGGPSPYSPPAGFRAAPPCGTYYGQKVDTTLPPYGNGFPSPAPWAVCGYAPPQLRSAYNLTGADDGTGQTVAITDAYAAPTLFADAHQYASINDPAHPLLSSQFSEVLPSSYNDGDLCGSNGWYGEQTLDVEAVHSTAPGAHILYVGAKNCAGELYGADRTVVDGHLANIITNSWLDLGGDVLDTASDRADVDNILLMAAGEGISVLYSSGDNGDDFTTFGVAVGNYPATSPWVTAVGGTTLQIGASGQRIGEYGWSTARSFLCNQTYVTLGGCTAAQLGTWLPIDLALDGGSGGGTSYVYPQPPYQAGVVPTSLSEDNGSTTPMRVYPDISMLGDPGTGMLVGETQTFPDGVYYDQYRIGGTSVASPLLAGVIARANETGGHALGFLNPKLYSLYGNRAAVDDILPAGKQDMSRADFANSVNANDGYLYSTRIIDYEGEEQFCDTSGCYNQDVALKTAPGYDNMTGLGSPGNSFVQDLSAP